MRPDEALADLPMFPLGSVLFPGAMMPLHVFEPRYRALTGYCIERQSPLGIVLIERGSEVGGGDVRFGVGTLGRIARSVALPDGRWVLAVQGERRVRIEEWLGEEPYPRARVSFFDDRTPPGAGAAAARAVVCRQATAALRLLAELDEWPPGDTRPDVPEDPDEAGWRVASFGLLGPADNQRLLETDGVDDRLDLLASLLAEEVDVLALRAAGR
ncbi:MAG: LON peptidase substrate-binding domain-containing protein [Acidimicrobiia bacterium]